MPRVTEAIQNFLRARRASHNAPELLDRWNPFMETQVNVAAGQGEPVEGKHNTYSDGIHEWWPIRIPKNASTTPEFKDYELRWPLDEHVEGIGWTGWDFAGRKSRALGFDFDSITGHAKGVGISDAELLAIRETASALPYVEVRKSTGGNGLHLYVYFDEAGVPTANHTEHAALGRAVLGMMASETGFDFASQIDACGGNMWIWHRKMTSSNQGLKLIKPATKSLSLSDLPANWRDHIEVVTRRRAKVRIHSELKDEHLDPFEVLASARKTVPLDDRHKAIIDELKRTGFSVVWVPDHHLLQTHTKALDKIFTEKHEELGLRGVFKTNSAGRDPGTPNCFAFPLENGGWRIYRFSPGIAEAETWNQDKEGWTNCYFNRRPNLKVAAEAMGATEDAERGGFVFKRAKQAKEAAEALGQKIDIDERLLKRPARLKAHKDGRLVMEITKKPDEADNKPLKGWLSKKGKWVKVFDVQTEEQKDETSYAEYDNLVRQLMTPAREDAGWYLRSSDNQWHRFSTEKVKMRLLALGNSDGEAKLILGNRIANTWKLVNVPFGSEYPGDRQWNIDAAQYVFQPIELQDDEVPLHPSWDKILKHCGQDLDGPVRDDHWCKLHNIRSGADYLLYWIACLMRHPFHPLPYLFLFGNQNSGKSILHEAISLLMTKGVASADRALTNAQEHNGELANCVLAYVEEKDLSAAGGVAYNRIKDWVTSPVMWIRKMRTDAYSQPNTIHFIQCANDLKSIALPPGDTRVCVLFVPDLLPGEEIPKGELTNRLKEEGPHFMRTLLDLPLPSPHSRLYLPAIKTRNKERAEDMNRCALDQFVTDNVYLVAGEMIEFGKFFEKFQEWLPTDKKHEWKKSVVLDEIRRRFTYGAHTGNKRMIGNVAWESKSVEPGTLPWVAKDGYLVRKDAA